MVNIKQINYPELYFVEEGNMSIFENNLISLLDVDATCVNDIFPVRSSFFSFFLIEEGDMEIELDYNTHTFGKYCFLITLPEHIIQSMKFSDTFKGKLIIIDQNYYMSIEKDNFRLYQPLFLNLRSFPGLQLNEDEYFVLTTCLDRIKQKIELQNHHLKESLIKTLLIESLLEIENILIDRNYNINIQKLSRQEELIYKFFQLLKDNGIVEHKVIFYADKLHISTQYLTFILKQFTGKTTHEWIANALIIEAKILLKHSEQNIQQISDFLNFYEPSAFGKFFKTHVGMTPYQFRQRKLNS